MGGVSLVPIAKTGDREEVLLSLPKRKISRRQRAERQRVEREGGLREIREQGEPKVVIFVLLLLAVALSVTRGGDGGWGGVTRATCLAAAAPLVLFRLKAPKLRQEHLDHGVGVGHLVERSRGRGSWSREGGGRRRAATCGTHLLPNQSPLHILQFVGDAVGPELDLGHGGLLGERRDLSVQIRGERGGRGEERKRGRKLRRRLLLRGRGRGSGLR
jgi:hypothetical protein